MRRHVQPACIRCATGNNHVCKQPIACQPVLGHVPRSMLAIKMFSYTGQNSEVATMDNGTARLKQSNDQRGGTQNTSSIHTCSNVHHPPPDYHPDRNRRHPPVVQNVSLCTIYTVLMDRNFRKPRHPPCSQPPCHHIKTVANTRNSPAKQTHLSKELNSPAANSSQ